MEYADYLFFALAGFFAGGLAGIVYSDTVRSFLVRKETAALAEVRGKYTELLAELEGMKQKFLTEFGKR